MCQTLRDDVSHYPSTLRSKAQAVPRALREEESWSPWKRDDLATGSAIVDLDERAVEIFVYSVTRLFPGRIAALR